MADDRDRALLVAFVERLDPLCKFDAGVREGYIEVIDAFLAARQPQTTPNEVPDELLPPAVCLYAVVCVDEPPPAPQTCPNCGQPAHFPTVPYCAPPTKACPDCGRVEPHVCGTGDNQRVWGQWPNCTAREMFGSEDAPQEHAPRCTAIVDDAHAGQEEHECLRAAVTSDPPRCDRHAPQRFWAVGPTFAPADHWLCVMVYSDGTHSQYGVPRKTREQAEADGWASGLPEWKPTGGGR
jgi:hypothetical protein